MDEIVHNLDEFVRQWVLPALIGVVILEIMHAKLAPVRRVLDRIHAWVTGVDQGQD